MDIEDLEISRQQKEKDSEDEETQLVIPREELPEEVLIADSLSDLRGHCKNFISGSERKTRDPQMFERSSKQHPNWEMVACHFRNTKYSEITVRDPTALKDTFIFLVQEYFPLIPDILDQIDKRNRLIHFLYDRMLAVRCQFHVQGLLYPQINLEIIKCLIVLQTLGNVPIRIVGLQNFLLPHIKKNLVKSAKGQKIFKEALQYSMVKSTKFELLEILNEHSEQILSDEHLASVLKSKTKIVNGNYRQFFKEVASNKNTIVRLIYWGQYEKMRDLAISAYKKSKMNEKAPTICKILCYRKMDGWVNVSQPAEWEKLQQFKMEYDLKVKLWVGQRNLKQIIHKLMEANQRIQ